MNKTSKATLALTFVLAVFSVSCNKEIPVDEPAQNVAGEGISSINVNLPDVSKVSLTPDTGSSKMILAWEEGDQLNVIGDNSELFTIQPGFTAKEGSFKAEEGHTVSGTSFSVLYPGTFSSVAAWNAYDWTSQVQNGNNTAGHLIWASKIEGVSEIADVVFSPDWATGKGGSFAQNGILKFHLQLPSSVSTVASVSLCVKDDIFHKDNDPSGPMTNILTLGLNSVDVSASSQVLTAYLGTSCIPVSFGSTDEARVIVVDTDGYSYEKVLNLTKSSTLDGGFVHTITLNNSNWTKGDGAEGKPILICTASQIDKLHTLMAAGQTTYVELATDIDMSSITGWTPLNIDDPYTKAVEFDGKGHMISNFSCSDQKYTSFFGVLNGTIRNTDFDNCTISSNQNNTLGVVCGYGGLANGTIAGSIKNVNITNSTVTWTRTGITAGSGVGVGGVVGTIGTGTYEDIVFDGTVNNKCTPASGVTDVRAGTGGLCGDLRQNTTVVNRVTVKGKVYSEHSKYTGGLVGYSRVAGLTITNCVNEAEVTSNQTYAERTGGISGHFQGGTVKNCVNKGKVTSKANLTGGILAIVSAETTIEGCSVDADIVGTTIVGGMIASNENTVTIKNCSYKGNITSSQQAGGIFGATSNGKVFTTNNTRKVIISDCCSTGSLTIPNGAQIAGGIVGDITANGPSTITNCWSDMTITGGRVLGGIVGRACYANWCNNASFASYDACLSISGCIAYNTIKCNDLRDVSACGSSGAIIGHTWKKNVMSNCWRKNGMSFTPSDSANGQLCDQDNSNGTNYIVGTTPGTAVTYGAPYHGKAAAAGATISSIASSLGWDATIWDFSGDKPVLKK